MRLPSTLASDAGRAVTLLRLFVLAAAVILAAGGAVLTGRLTATVRSQAVDGEVNSAGVFASALLSPAIVRGDHLVPTSPAALQLGRAVRVPESVRSLNAWKPDGTLVFSNVGLARIGHRLPLDDGLREFFRTGKSFANFIDLRTDADERATANGRPGHPRQIDTYAPILGASGRVIGAYEVYVEADHVDAVVAHSTRTIWLTVGGVFTGLFAVLALLARSASRRLQAQSAALRKHADDLQDSYRLLEQSSLETIRTLNATVEAKDPYTAGHSHRVRAVAVVLGRRLGLSEDGLELLGAAALFHDVGKIGVPDAILTKPTALTPAEFEIVKQHAARGAEILSNSSRLRGAVPAVRHHHERWDGLGYPDGLAAMEIPLEAAIIGLADAWDAMTTARYYSDALPTEAALAQLRAGRGSQFRPDVVDAFLAEPSSAWVGTGLDAPHPVLRAVAARG